MFELRSFRSGDAEGVWKLQDAALENAGVHGGRGPWEDDLREIGATYADPGGCFLVALADGELVGMGGLLRRSPDECEIRRMRVHPDFQRQGLGRLILRELEQRARALGFRMARLDTTDEQFAARRLYESAGYREIGRRHTGRFLFIDFAKALRAPDGSEPLAVGDSSRDTPVLIVTGPPGVGKTTTAGILAARAARAVHLEADAFFRFIRSGSIEPWKPESRVQNEIVMRIVARAAADYATAGYFTIVDGIVIPEWFLDPLRDALHGAGHSVAYVVLRAPLSTCVARVQDREGVPLADPDVIEQIWQSFADLGDLERNAIEIGDKSPDEAGELLARQLAEGALAV